ncbi:MAG: cytochrome C oxidase subunit IV family protein [Bryobacterales bacterium]|nr:cytochrome C oxidase subunit IV family protein [Bryobacterales bacterium]
MSLEKQTMEGMRHHGEETHTHDHTKWYIGTIIALFLLTAVTVLAAGVDFGSNTTNLIIAMVIATVKASLVALFFMHLRWEKGMNAIIFLSSIFFVGVFMIFTLFDINTRAKIEAAGPSEPGAAAGYEPPPLPMYVREPQKTEGGTTETTPTPAGGETAH